jgi:hypothetical protein
MQRNTLLAPADVLLSALAVLRMLLAILIPKMRKAIPITKDIKAITTAYLTS